MKQFQLGYEQIKAAVLGGHDLMDAYNEIEDMSDGDERKYVLIGSLGCLAACTGAVSVALGLPKGDTPDEETFFGATCLERQWLLKAASDRGDTAAMQWMAAAMARSIQPHSARITFDGLTPGFQRGPQPLN
jgi:hypothetical protein